MTDTEQHIRERAYHLWIANGRNGPADAHWLAAEREVLATFAATRPAQKAAPKKAKKATAAKQNRAA